MDLTFWLGKGFDFVLFADVPKLFITPARSRDWIDSFLGVDFDMLNSMDF